MHQSGWFISRESDRESGRGSKAKSRKKVDLSSAATITRGFISDPIERLPSSQSTKEFIKARHLESIVSRTGSPSHAAHLSTMAAKANMGSIVRPLPHPPSNIPSASSAPFPDNSWMTYPICAAQSKSKTLSEE